VDSLLILLVALAIDLALGEPPRPIHPVVWMGKVASFLERGGAGQHRSVQFVYEVDSDLGTRPGPRIVEGLEEMAGIVHPDLFER